MCFHFSWVNKYRRLEYLGQRRGNRVVLQATARPFLKALKPFCTPPKNVYESSSSTSLPAFWWVCSGSILWFQFVCCCWLIMLNTFSWAYWPSVHLSWSVYSSHSPIFIELSLFLSCKNSLRIPVLCHMLCKYCIFSCGLPASLMPFGEVFNLGKV